MKLKMSKLKPVNVKIQIYIARNDLLFDPAKNQKVAFSILSRLKKKIVYPIWLQVETSIW